MAVTLAKEQLYLSYPLFSRDNVLQPSPFIKELPYALYERWDLESGESIDAEEVIYVDEDEEYEKSQPPKKKKLLNFNADIGESGNHSGHFLEIGYRKSGTAPLFSGGIASLRSR